MKIQVELGRCFNMPYSPFSLGTLKNWSVKRLMHYTAIESVFTLQVKRLI